MINLFRRFTSKLHSLFKKKPDEVHNKLACEMLLLGNEIINLKDQLDSAIKMIRTTDKSLSKEIKHLHKFDDEIVKKINKLSDQDLEALYANAINRYDDIIQRRLGTWVTELRAIEERVKYLENGN